MVVEVQWYNVGIVAGMCVILIYQLNNFKKSEKPIFIEPQNLDGRKEKGQNSLGEPIFTIEKQYTNEEFQEVREEAKKEYNKKKAIYYITYLLPTIFALLSITAVINLEIGITFLIIAIVSTVIMEIIIKVYAVGEKKFVGQVR